MRGKHRHINIGERGLRNTVGSQLFSPNHNLTSYIPLHLNQLKHSLVIESALFQQQYQPACLDSCCSKFRRLTGMKTLAHPQRKLQLVNQGLLTVMCNKPVGMLFKKIQTKKNSCFPLLNNYIREIQQQGFCISVNILKYIFKNIKNSILKKLRINF